MKIKNYKDLIAWQKSMDLVKYVYDLTDEFPGKETYVLTQQIRRSAISIPSNIAEGSSKKSTPEFLRFLNIAYGSLAELETQLQIAEKVGYTKNVNGIYEKTAEIAKIISGLINSLEEKKITKLSTLNSNN